MILLSNDDGFNAEGIQILRRELAKFYDVMIVAPEAEQSAKGHAITLSEPLRVREVKEEGCLIGYAVNGTPADCIKVATTVLLEETPELVISGINLGGNLGTCAIYSGTVSAATEAAIMGIPAIAVSLDTFVNPDFSASAEFIRNLIPQIMKRGIPAGVALNVNVPAVPKSELKGVAITRQGKSRVIETFDKRIDPRNNVYYWLAGEMRFDEVDEDADCRRVADNYISITPVHFDLTRHEFLSELKSWKLSLD